MSREPKKPRRDQDVKLDSVGALIGDPARTRVLLALVDGRALPASVLAREAGVEASTVSGHLRQLVDGGLLVAERHGRYRYFRLAGPQTAGLLEGIATFAAHEFTPRSLRPGTREYALRYARTCYDHLAGRLGVALMRALLDGGLLAGHDGTYDRETAPTDRLAAAGHDVDYELTDAGHTAMVELGVPLRAGSRPSVAYCVDWTEQCHHLRGALGTSLLERFLELDWIRRTKDSRAIRLTDAGADALSDRLGVDVPRAMAGR